MTTLAERKYRAIKQKKWTKKHLERSRKIKREYMSRWRQSLKEKGLYEEYLSKRREWKRLHKESSTGNEKWKQLEQLDWLWERYNKMIPNKVLQEMLSEDYYKKCVRYKENTCKGRVTFEHVWIYAGKQIQEKWAIIPLCEYHHDVLSYQDSGDLIKELNQYYSLKRATDEDLRKYPRKNWKQLRIFLNTKYGTST